MPLTTTIGGTGSGVDITVSDGGGGGQVAFVADVFVSWDPAGLKLDEWTPQAGAISTAGTICWPKQEIPSNTDGVKFTVKLQCRDAVEGSYKVFVLAVDAQRGQVAEAGHFIVTCPLPASPAGLA